MLGTLAASMWGSALTGRGVIRTDEGEIRAADKNIGNEPKFIGVYSNNNLFKIY